VWAGSPLWRLDATSQWPIWRLGPAVAVAQRCKARGTCAGAAGHSHRGQSRRGVAGGQGSPMAPLWCGQWHGHEDGERSTPGKKNVGVAHRGGRTSVRWQRETDAVAFRRWRMAHDGWRRSNVVPIGHGDEGVGEGRAKQKEKERHPRGDSHHWKQGRRRCPDRFRWGETVAYAQRQSNGVSGGRGSFRARWSEVRRSFMARDQGGGGSGTGGTTRRKEEGPQPRPACGRRSASTRKRQVRIGAWHGGMEHPGQGSQGADTWAPWPQCQRFKPFQWVQWFQMISNSFKTVQT
jgi:hypothetical protein